MNTPQKYMTERKKKETAKRTLIQTNSEGRKEGTHKDFKNNENKYDKEGTHVKGKQGIDK